MAFHNNNHLVLYRDTASYLVIYSSCTVQGSTVVTCNTCMLVGRNQWSCFIDLRNSTAAHRHRHRYRHFEMVLGLGGQLVQRHRVASIVRCCGNDRSERSDDNFDNDCRTTFLANVASTFRKKKKYQHPQRRRRVRVDPEFAL